MKLRHAILFSAATHASILAICGLRSEPSRVTSAQRWIITTPAKTPRETSAKRPHKAPADRLAEPRAIQPATPEIAPPAPAAPGPTAADAVGDAMPYFDALRAAIERHAAYPENASGDATPVVRLTIAADGSLTTLEIAKTAGARFDAAALAAVRAAAPFTPPPKTKTGRLKVSLPVAFRRD